MERKIVEGGGLLINISFDQSLFFGQPNSIKTVVIDGMVQLIFVVYLKMNLFMLNATMILNHIGLPKTKILSQNITQLPATNSLDIVVKF